MNCIFDGILCVKGLSVEVFWALYEGFEVIWGSLYGVCDVDL